MSFFFFSSRRRHTRFDCDWSSDVCSSDLGVHGGNRRAARERHAERLGDRRHGRRGAHHGAGARGRGEIEIGRAAGRGRGEISGGGGSFKKKKKKREGIKERKRE